MADRVDEASDDIDSWLALHAAKAKLLPSLIDTLAATCRGGDSEGIESQLQRVSTAFAEQVAADEAEGAFLDAALAKSPRFGHEIAAVRAAEQALVGELDDARRAIAELRDLTERLRQHLDRTNRLAWRLVNEESGTGD